MRTFVALLFVAGLQAIGFAQEFLPDEQVVLTEREAVIAMPPIALANDVDSAEWSPSGRFVLMLRRQPFPKITAELLRSRTPPPGFERPAVTVTSWARESRRTADLGRFDQGRLMPQAWFAETDVALTFLAETKEIVPGQSEPRIQPGQIAWITPATNQIRVLNAPIPGIQMAVVQTAPKGNLAIIQFGVGEKYGYFVVDATGRLIRTQEAVDGGLFPQWLPDGQHLEITRIVRSTGEERPRIERRTINAQTGAEVRPPNQEAIVPATTPIPEPDIEVLSARLNTPPMQRPNVLYLKGVDSSALALSLNANEGFLAPKLDAVLYLEMGVAMVRELSRIPKDLYLELRKQAARRAAMSQAKQVALGLIMYSADYDDVLPTQEDWENKVMPYLKNREIMSGFNYTFRGGEMTKIDNPSETELGYIDIPGGRVVAYADGHVKFIENPPALAKDRPRRVHGTLASSG